VRLFVLGALLVAGSAGAAPVRQSTTSPHPGITVEEWSDAAIPAAIHLVKVDLTSSEIAVYATKEQDKGITTTEFAQRIGAQVAINGDSFALASYTPRGLAIGGMAPWSNTADDATSAVFHMNRAGERTYAAIEVPETVLAASDLPDGTEGAVSGRPLLVRSGVVTSQFDCNDPVTLACQRAPRSAVGVSQSGDTMYFVVVDGWQSGSLGMTASEVAAFIQARGAFMAMALDGGSSSSLVLDNALASSPSDGVERSVANHIGVKYGALPKGELYGLICKHSVVGCGGDSSRWIVGASVRLDDGRTQTSGADASYDFPNVTLRLACVTVKKTGFLTVHQCRQVDQPGQLNYNSVAMFEGTDALDAGVMDATATDIDAATSGDGGGGDGGNGKTGPGGGCCDAGRDGTGSSVMLAVLSAWFLRRRRGTNELSA
jgi:exopolysaccharide biosynthesis protein